MYADVYVSVLMSACAYVCAGVDRFSGEIPKSKSGIFVDHSYIFNWNIIISFSPSFCGGLGENGSPRLA